MVGSLRLVALFSSQAVVKSFGTFNLYKDPRKAESSKALNCDKNFCEIF